MSDERTWAAGRDGDLLSLEQMARLDAYLVDLVAERRPRAAGPGSEDEQERQLAAQLRLLREGAEVASPEFMATLELRMVQELARHPRRRDRLVSRGGFLRTAATLAGGAGLGVGGVEGMAAMQGAGRPHDLVVLGNECWYPIARDGEVPPGGSKPFSAGGVLGFLLNTDGRLHAVSAICTHMGCRLKASLPGDGPGELRCLCHGSRFNRRGAVIDGHAPSPLPAITIREENGQVYALGTRETP